MVLYSSPRPLCLEKKLKVWKKMICISQRLMIFAEALAASNVKIAGKDVLATWKVLISLGMGPVLYIFYATLATIIAIKADMPWSWIVWTPILTLCVLPAMSYAALKFGEAGMDVLKCASHCSFRFLTEILRVQVPSTSYGRSTSRPTAPP